MANPREHMMGMSTNERLFEAGLMQEFDKAVRQLDEDKVREILKSVFVDEPSIDVIIREYIASTKDY